MEIISELLEVTVDTDATVKIDSKLPEARVDITKSITAEIQPENYVLTSGGIYTGNLTGAVPTWLLNAIQQQLTTGDGNVMSVLDDMKLLLGNLQLGVNQAISQIENTNVSMSALETSLSSRINENSADILDVYTTRVTADEAQAIATTAIETTFDGNVDAYIGNLASVYTAPGSATATNISTLQTSYNDQTARIDTVEEVTIGLGTAIQTLEEQTGVSIAELQAQVDGVIDSWYYSYLPDQTNLPWSDWYSIDNSNGNTIEQTRHLGDLFYDLTTGTAYRFVDSNGVFGWNTVTDTAITLALQEASTAQYTADGKASIYYSEGLPEPKVEAGVTIPIEVGDLWVNSGTQITKVALVANPTLASHWGDISNTAAEQAVVWSANASKLITSPDGSVTGWQFADGTGVQSEFKIQAEKFSISDGTTGYTPFLIDGTDIKFNGLVEFSNVNGAPTHTSGLLSARPLTAVLGSTYTATDGGEAVLYTYTSSGWIQGGDPDALTAADLGPAGTTTIDGGRIITGSIVADRINVSTLSALTANLGTINAGVLYNYGGSASNYSMKIDLNNGEIFIK